MSGTKPSEEPVDDNFPDAHWGTAETLLPDWRASDDEDADPDDEQLLETPPDVIAMLGFDPLDEDASPAPEDAP